MSTRTARDTDTDDTWRRRAVITSIWSSAIALALLIAAAVIIWSWRDQLPHPWPPTGAADPPRTDSPVSPVA